MPASRPTERRAERFRPGPLRVELEGGAKGTLVDLSEYGAMVDIPTQQRIDSFLEFDLYWDGLPAKLQGRVVRSTPIYDGERLAWMEPTSYHVAVEFDLEARSTVRLYDFVQRAKQGLRD